MFCDVNIRMLQHSSLDEKDKEKKHISERRLDEKESARSRRDTRHSITLDRVFQLNNNKCT